MFAAEAAPTGQRVAFLVRKDLWLLLLPRHSPLVPSAAQAMRLTQCDSLNHFAIASAGIGLAM